MSSNTTTPATNDAQEKGLAQFNPIKERVIALVGEDRFNREATFLLQKVNSEVTMQACTKQSIAGALLSVATTNLTLNPIRNEAYLIPRNFKVRDDQGRERYEKRLTIVPSYIGLMKLATDTGSIRYFESHVVYEGDQFEYDVVEKKPRTHKPYWTINAERGKVIGVYGFVVLVDGNVIPDHMGADELAKIRSKSDNANGAVYNDWEGEMSRKALLKRMQKHVPRTDRSDAFLKAIQMDNEDVEVGMETTPEERTMKVWRDRVRKALEFYQGDDKETIQQMCVDKSGSGEFTEEFARQILAQMGTIFE